MNEQNRSFIFLYPQEEIFDYELEKGAILYEGRSKIRRALKKAFLPRIERAETEAEKEAIQQEARNQLKRLFRPFYSKKLNACIDERYRKKGYAINYALLDDCAVSDIIALTPRDRVIYVGMDAKTHRTKGSDGEYPYPKSDYIIDQLLPVGKLVIGGFHLGDCVEKLAMRAYSRGLEVLIDEDLTELFTSKVFDKAFRTNAFSAHYPSLKISW